MTRKEQIVETAIELFATESFESVSIQKLANETGVAQGLLYRHFKGKDDLLKHLILKGLEQVSITLQPYSDSSLSFEQAFARHLKRSLQYLHSDYKLWKVLHNTRTHMIHVYVDDKLAGSWPDRGTQSWHFKNGVYGTRGRSEVRFRNIKYWVKN